MSATTNTRRPLTGRDLYRAIFLLTVIAIVGYFFRDILTFLMISLVAILVALALAAGANLMARARLPRAAGVLLTLLLFVGAFMVLVYVLLPPLIDQLIGFLTDLPEILATLREELASRVVAVEGDLVQFPITYFFHNAEERNSLPVALPYLLRLAEKAGGEELPPEVRLRARMLHGALEGFSNRVASKAFLSLEAASTEEALRAYADDHLQIPERVPVVASRASGPSGRASGVGTP